MPAQAVAASAGSRPPAAAGGGASAPALNRRSTRPTLQPTFDPLTFNTVAPSDREIAAVDGDRAAGHPARLVGGEKQDRADQVRGLAEAGERDQRLGRPPRRGV